MTPRMKQSLIALAIAVVLAALMTTGIVSPEMLESAQDFLGSPTEGTAPQ